MEINSRFYEILRFILLQRHVDCSMVQKYFNISFNQLDYSIEGINTLLKMKELPSLIVKNGCIYVPEQLRILEESILNTKTNLVLSTEERKYATELMMICKQKYISLQDFEVAFGVSKNTALNTIKKLQEELERFGLKIIYNRTDGYSLIGNELMIRNQVGYCIQKLKNCVQNNSIYKICQIEDSEIRKNNSIIKEIEKTLGVQFVESKKTYLPFLIAIYNKRVEMGNILKDDDLIYNELHDTREFIIVSEIISKNYIIPKNELYFYNLMILSVSISKFTVIDAEYSKKLKDAIELMVEKFELNACVKFSEGEVLRNNLFQHLLAAYYRIKYNLTLSSDVIEVMEKSYNNEMAIVHRILEKSIYPIENLIGVKISDIEFDFLSIQFVSWMRREHLMTREKVIAVVVCPNGISISNLMFMSLKKIFPEIEFMAVYSISDFEKINIEDYDIVFSNSQIKTTKKVVIINSLNEMNNRKELRKQVFEQLNWNFNHDDNLSIILKVIEKSQNVVDKDELICEIKKAIENENVNKEKKYLCNPTLIELIGLDRIQIVKNVRDYLEAINIVSKPLLEKNIITKGYIEVIANQYLAGFGILTIGNEIAIPHASYTDGTKALAMSLLVIKDGVMFGEKRIHIVIMLSPIDNYSHVNSLIQLSEISEDDKLIDEIIESQSGKEILTIIQANVDGKEVKIDD